ncbi:hypothetical protein CXG81DRAFT_25093 [Caulochytrium protostelioides]|uniref:Uncharacterized protein n=1 Tax=Caulochytrium protostelioides TaxID=1555241 RepID=A0A4P9XA44_9FUNG|nr:hypothetical protein CXG81DRAFT_25093 [Caulochytrium protostelioides]|eukprot:RKP02233.1 hypothetical protein CXG81DRAFT_25093 [Caulochytrium protostelioides]
MSAGRIGPWDVAAAVQAARAAKQLYHAHFLARIHPDRPVAVPAASASSSLPQPTAEQIRSDHAATAAHLNAVVAHLTAEADADARTADGGPRRGRREPPPPAATLVWHLLRPAAPCAATAPPTLATLRLAVNPAPRLLGWSPAAAAAAAADLWHGAAHPTVAAAVPASALARLTPDAIARLRCAALATDLATAIALTHATAAAATAAPPLDWTWLRDGYVAPARRLLAAEGLARELASDTAHDRRQAAASTASAHAHLQSVYKRALLRHSPRHGRPPASSPASPASPPRHPTDPFV